MTTLKHTWKKGRKYPIEMKLHVDEEKAEYWIEVNGCQETDPVQIPNVGLENRGAMYYKFRED